MSTRKPLWYSYADIQRRIREVLGVDVATSTLRAAPTREGRALSRVTEGMPAPLRQDRPMFAAPARFSVDEVEGWLETHPLHRQQDALQAIEASRSDRRVLVDQARSAGVSWARIATAISAAEGRSYSAQAAHKRYGRSAG